MVIVSDLMTSNEINRATVDVESVVNAMRRCIDEFRSRNEEDQE